MHRWIWIGMGLLGAWLAVRYLLPLLFPFGLGLALALAAEPAVRAGNRYLKLPRWAAAGTGVSLTLLLLTALVVVVALGLPTVMVSCRAWRKRRAERRATHAE